MTSEALLGATLGAILGVGYIISIFVTYRQSISRDTAAFMKAYFGGMSLRLFVALAAFSVVLAITDIQPSVFAGTFLSIFVAGLVLEVYIVFRANRPHRDSTASTAAAHRSEE